MPKGYDTPWHIGAAYRSWSILRIFLVDIQKLLLSKADGPNHILDVWSVIADVSRSPLTGLSHERVGVTQSNFGCTPDNSQW
jgi:hypothetical protein